MGEQADEFLERLRDDLAGLRDALDTADLPGALLIAEGFRDDCPAQGWPLAGRLAGDLCAMLDPETGADVPFDVVEVMVDAIGMVISANSREEADMDEALRDGLQLLQEKFGL